MPTIPQALAIAVEHHQAGRLQAAEQIYRRILAIEPNHADALHLLGAIAHQMGNDGLAVETIRRAIAVNGSVAAFHVNLANALKRQGKLDEALASYLRALELVPDFAEVYVNLGNTLKEQGKADEALAAYRRALELKPDFAEAHNNLGNLLKERDRPDDALACYRRALELKPDYAQAHNNLGVALKELGSLDEAIACGRRALALKPDYVEAHNNLGIALAEQGKLDEAVASCRRALDLKPDFAEAHYNLGNLLGDQGRLQEALACYRRALELRPDDAAADCNLGHTLKELGDLQGAEDAYRAALGHDSGFAFAHYKLAELLGGKLPEGDLAAQRRLLAEGELTCVQRSFLHFGLAHVLDARGEYVEAAEHAQRANALQDAQWRTRGREYDPRDYESLVTRMIAISSPDFFRRAGDFGLASELPVFVVGLPRSGTTLIEQILASHSQVFGAGEIELARETLAALGGQDTDALEGLRGLDRAAARHLAERHLERLCALEPAALRIVDKMPENYFSLGLLAVLFPRAKFIHCRRDLRDVAVSCWMTHFRKVRWASDQVHLASRFRQYQRLMEHWRTVLPAPLLEVDYEETVADLEGAARRLVAWCGLVWEPECLEFHRAQRPVRTASAVQVRQPVFRTSVGRWRHYEQALAPLFAALEGW
jgi:tetratricopeptide (TPR) repeat protein